jgi:hypothetical protein
MTANMSTSTEEFKTDPARYTPEDLLLWQANNALEITPKFQRRPVWRTPARSYFIDTLLRGMTVPPLYLRMTQNQTKTKAIRQVVDGQQRVRSVLDFIGGGYRLSKNLKAPWAGHRFADLSEEQQQQIRTFSFSTETFKGISDAQILQVFCRLNMNGIALNQQELRNGKYFGSFKQTSYDLALMYYEFWTKTKMFSDQGIARMLEVELTSELLIAGHVGMQDKKKTINKYYEEWETAYPDEDKDKKRFIETMSAISETFNLEGLAASQFRRPPLFYSLYCAVFHHVFGLPDFQRATPRKKLTTDERDGLKEAVALLSEKILESKDPTATIPAKYKGFVAACARQTDNILPRKTRLNTILDQAF